MRSALLAVVLAVVWAVVLAAGVPALFAAEDEKGKLPAEVFGSWVHSREDDTAPVEAYRPKDFKFPPSRGRAGFEIRKDGTFIDRPIAPADGNETVPGKWEPAGEGKIKVTFPAAPARKPFTLRIVSCDAAVLRVERMGPEGIPAGVPDGWELVKNATYTASQTPGDVTIVARGQHPTGGYQTELVKSPLKIWPPQYLLVCRKPDGKATQVVSPFEVKATLTTRELVKTVVVSDSAGRHEVKVDQARD